MENLILVVEDSRTQAEYLESILQSQNYQVAIADNGQKAMEWLSDHKPSLIISDILMPEMNGYELCLRIKTQPTTQDIPVILMTSLTKAEEVIEGLIAGADSFISKPYDKDYLISHIDKILADQSGINTEKKSVGIEIIYEGKKRFIQADQQQIIKLLLNIYDGAIHQNSRLLQTQEQLRLLNENLETLVEERTLALSEETKMSVQIAEKLKESEQSLQYVLQGSQLGFWDWNLETNEVKRNERWAEMLGYRLDDIEFTVNQWTDFIHPDDQAKAMKSIEDHLDGLTPMHRLEYRMRKKGGQYIWILDQAQAVKWNNEGKVIRMSGTHTDITDRKLAEEQIKHKNEELLKLNAEKDKFFSIIAHDLRNPFNAFLGFTEMLVEDLPELKLNQILEMAEMMQKSAKNLFSLLNNLLEWSQIQHGSIPFNPAAIHLRSMADESLALAFDAAKNKDIELVCDIPVQIEVFADSHLLETVIRNLVSNALKFTPKGGKVSLSAKTDGDKNIEISFKDTGIGMNQSMVENLFRLDVKTNRLGTNGELSTGLGLLLCKEFIEKHGGKIWVESEVGKGSTFYFTIPFKDELNQGINV